MHQGTAKNPKVVDVLAQKQLYGLFKTVNGELVQVEFDEILRECPDLAKYFEPGSTAVETLDTSSAQGINPLYSHWTHAATRLMKSLKNHKDGRFFLYPVEPVRD